MVSQPFNVLLLGAGAVNFGTPEGPWCHTTRLERKLGARLNVVGLVDPVTSKAEARLAEKRGVVGYEHTEVFGSIAAAGEALTGTRAPALVVAGVQPEIRGSHAPGRDVELQVQRAFPSTPLFVEKPLSSSPVAEVVAVAAALGGTRTSVGYMFRYLEGLCGGWAGLTPAVQTIRRLIAEHGLQVTATVAQYYMAYEHAGTPERHAGYFDLGVEVGPIVSQATHIVDLCVYLAGPADLASVHTHTLEVDEGPGVLSKLGWSSDIPTARHIPRVTTAVWKYATGAVATLVHGVSLHDGDYETELVVLADGWKFKLVDPYGVPRLHVRRPGQPEEAVTVYKDDDPFFTEMATFIDVIEGVVDESAVLSTYNEAIRTYELTWAIRNDGDKNRDERRARAAQANGKSASNGAA
ncbi:hypothetical protein Q8F55_009282 [Vanrija albida]|uniref:Gfo/Idh/MocA-like oxidoreductase N-terminal domain-containing protein n=1 Tax=Vanrija albida TaxID=181172 RepID=A0ABR3PT80_9TREE